MAHNFNGLTVGDFVKCPTCGMPCVVESADSNTFIVPDRSHEQGLDKQLRYTKGALDDATALVEKVKQYLELEAKDQLLPGQREDAYAQIEEEVGEWQRNYDDAYAPVDEK